MNTVAFNVDRLLRQLSAKNNKSYDKVTVAALSGISRTTITSITNNENKRCDFETLGKLLDFFQGQGMPITIADLFTVEQHP
jgi:DNA-binding XRE family transcriptional regulator